MLQNDISDNFVDVHYTPDMKKGKLGQKKKSKLLIKIKCRNRLKSLWDSFRLGYIKCSYEKKSGLDSVNLQSHFCFTKQDKAQD